MFQVNDVIIYGTQGVCTITGTDVKSVGGVKKTYYILQPVRENGCTVYAPVDNPHVLKLSGKEDLMTYIFDRIEHNKA